MAVTAGRTGFKNVLLLFCPALEKISHVIIAAMKNLRWPAPLILLFLLACQPQHPALITILDNRQVHTIATGGWIPAKILAQAGVTLAPADRVLLNGQSISSDQPLPPAKTYTLQIKHAAAVTINGKTLQTTADTVGEALKDLGMQLFAADQINPPADTPITNGMAITYTPSRQLIVTVDGKRIQIRSSAQTVGGALAEAGIPLIGLDYSQPSENEALPQDGQIRIVRVSESIVLAETPIAFKTDYQSSAELAVDQQKTLQAGAPGLAVSRTRIRYEDGKEVLRQTEPEAVVQPPLDRIVAYGTKVQIQTTIIGGVQIQYWRVLQMYATAYSPCNSGAGKCYSGTASGLPAGKGVVAVDPSIYYALAGQRLYIPGYGFAVIGDLGGGYLIEQQLGISRKRWIDLGFSDAEYAQIAEQWGRYVTVYFLAPIPPNADALN
jgi:uncharacterized protein YabE (DUF348 family)